MAKTYFERKGKKPTVSAASQSILRSKEEELAMHRVSEALPLSDILAKLNEHGIKTWHMRCALGQVMIFLGSDAPDVVAQIYDFIYASKEPC